MRILMGTDPAAASLVEHEGAKLCLGAGFEEDSKYLNNEMFGAEDELDVDDDYYSAFKPGQFRADSSSRGDGVVPNVSFNFVNDGVARTSSSDISNGFVFENSPTTTSTDACLVNNPHQRIPNRSCTTAASLMNNLVSFQNPYLSSGHTASSIDTDKPKSRQHPADLASQQPQKKSRTELKPSAALEPCHSFAVETTRAIAPIQIPSLEKKFPCAPMQMAVVKGSDGATYLQALFALNDVVDFGGRQTASPCSADPTPDSSNGSHLAKVEEKPAVRDNAVVKVRKYSNATSSRFCHVCARSSRGVPMAVCQNVHHGVCRKVICEKCCVSHGWEFVAPTPEVVAGKAQSGFVCAHCKGLCPDKAQCNTYKRTNQRRRAKGAEKRKAIEKAMANGGDVGAVLKEQGDC